MIGAFDASTNARVMLVSTKAGSLGINLTSARYMLVLDVAWNPVHNAQVGWGGLPWSGAGVGEACLVAFVWEAHSPLPRWSPPPELLPSLTVCLFVPLDP